MASLLNWPDSDETGGVYHVICAMCKCFLAELKIKVKCSQTLLRPSHEYFLAEFKLKVEYSQKTSCILQFIAKYNQPSKC